MPVPINAAVDLRNALDHDGCAYGQVSRERLTHIQDGLDRVEAQSSRVEARLTYVLAAIALQFLGFFIAVVVYVLERAH